MIINKNNQKTMLKFAAFAASAMLTVPVLQPCMPQNGIVTAQAKTAARQRTKSYVVASDILNVRCGPGTDYAVIGSLTRGLRVKVISISGEKGNRWAKIRFEGVRAYVSAQYLTKTVS